MTRTGAILTLLLIAAAVLRLHTAATMPPIGDEDHINIYLADRISFSPGQLNLPIRGLHHPALPSYLIKLSGALFGATALGYRALDVFFGVAAMLLVFRTAKTLFGPAAGLWAVALLAFNEYHVIVSSLATAKGPHLFFVTIAIFAFTRFLVTERAGYLYGAAAAVGFAFYCKEHSALFIPAFFLTLLLPRYRGWLRQRHPYLACALFALMLVPDVAANMARPADPQAQVAATYRDHLARIGGVGLNPYPALFFLRNSGDWSWITSRYSSTEIEDRSPEYPSMNIALGLLLLGAVAAAMVRPDRVESRFLLILFWVFFGFLSLIRPGHPANGMDPVTWYWVDVAMFPAVIFAAGLLARGAGPWTRALQVGAIAALLLAIAELTRTLPIPG